MSQPETWTIKRLLEWTIEFFTKNGCESPRLEAEILLGEALKCKRIELYTNFETEPSEEKRARFREFVKRRGAGEPSAYLVGSKEFFSIPFKVDRSVLIPRPETEQLVLETLDRLKTMPPGSVPSVCDVGTGSGAIAVSVAKNWPKTLGPGRIVAVDKSPEALEIAKQNAEAAGLAGRIEFVESDLLDAAQGSFDVIVSNPPYVSRSEYDALPDGIKNFEPESALLAGPKGTEVIERLMIQAKDRLNSGGWLLIEGSPMIAADIAGLLTDWPVVGVVKDAASLDRFIIAQK